MNCDSGTGFASQTPGAEVGKHRGQGRAEQSEVPTEELDEEVSWEKLWFPRPKSSRGHLELTEGFLVRETGTGTPVWGRCKASGLVCYAPIYKVLWFVRLLNVEQQGEGWLWAVWLGIVDFLLVEIKCSLVILSAFIAVFSLVFLFIVLCGGGIEIQVSTRENFLTTYIAFPLLSTPVVVFDDSVHL